MQEKSIREEREMNKTRGQAEGLDRDGASGKRLVSGTDGGDLI